MPPAAAASRVIVTGGSGFIGSNLVLALQQAGATVLNLDIAAPRNPALAGSWQAVDLRDAKALREAVARFEPEVVHHLGARTDLDSSAIGDYDANTDGVRHLDQALGTVRSDRRVLFASSRLVCRIGYQPASDSDYCPTTAYGASKVEGERSVRRDAADAHYGWTIVRPTSIWRPWFDFPYRMFFDAIARGRYVHPRGQVETKSFVYIGNLVHALPRLAGYVFYLDQYLKRVGRAMVAQVAAGCGAPPVRKVPMALLCRPTLVSLPPRGSELLFVCSTGALSIAAVRVPSLKGQLGDRTDVLAKATRALFGGAAVAHRVCNLFRERRCSSRAEHIDLSKAQVPA